MERATRAQEFTEQQAAPVTFNRLTPSSKIAEELVCYWLQADAASAHFTSSLLPTFPHSTPSDDDFLLFSAERGALPASLLQDVAKLSDQRPELNCFIVSLAKRELAAGLHSSTQLFQQLHEQRWWQQGAFAVILRAGLARSGAPLNRIQDVMLAGLLHTQTAWVLDYASETALAANVNASQPFTYQQFITDYEKLTRLSHFIPERNRYRESYLRSGLLQLVQQELSSADKFSDNIRHALTYFADNFPVQGAMEKLMLKQPDIYFSIMKMRKRLGA
ncbi:hypothetical protein AC790_04575 [Pantoea sp. RIT-PI-b]|uniref:hypothetical protein n=1 Tax=Pantoea sp. RIT-PI-b TaxID=1681195 RepID=UPI000675D039|nr:hypothetical protein [Pantoea sp. RIT-PI-b]KNC15613.1 hypothetical protein AC790_04575 [Pantoea sp. RIT-PI-b]